MIVERGLLLRILRMETKMEIVTTSVGRKTPLFSLKEIQRKIAITRSPMGSRILKSRVILSLAWREEQPVEKLSEEGERFSCFVHHLDGDGLVQISRQTGDSSAQKIYRFDRYGGLKGVFISHADGRDDLLYDRDSGYGRRHETEVDCSAMVGCLELVLSDDEVKGFHW
jgi:hypothetical protein